MTLLDEDERDLSPYLEVRVPRGVACDSYQIELFAVMSDLSAGAVPTLICSTDRGLTYDVGAHYTDNGFSQWGYEGLSDCAGFMDQAFGIRIGPDTGDWPDQGVHGTVRVSSPGMVAGVAVHTAFRADTMKGEYSRQTILTSFTGQYTGAVGVRVNAWRLQCNRQAEPAALTRGLIKLWGRQ